VAVELDTLTFDTASPLRVGAFWAEVLGFELDPDSDEEGAYIRDPSGRTRGVFFQPVPEPKTAKNRLHIDLRPSGSMDEEVERLRGLGATVVGRVDVESSFWNVM
jgi:Glyoxalase-like domain